MFGTFIKRERIAQNISQESLAKGICVPSYLSKIENNQLTGSDEVIEQLFDILGIHYIYDEDRIKEFDEAFQEWYTNVCLKGDTDLLNVRQKEWLKLAKSMNVSSRVIEALQLQYLLSEEKKDLYNELAYFYPLMSRKQLFLSKIIEADHFNSLGDAKKAENIYISLLMEDDDGIAVYELSKHYFNTGQYHRSIETGKTAYRKAADNANIAFMLGAAGLIGGSYSNINDLRQFKHYSNLALKLNVYFKEAATDYLVYYNLGATELCLGHYEEALSYFKKALCFVDEGKIDKNQSQIFYQKIVINYVYLNEIEKAKEYFTLLEPSEKSLNNKIREMLSIMVNYPNYIKESNYIDRLYECFEETQRSNHHGFVLFYAGMLIDAYKANHQYKKALEMSEFINISNNIDK